jgi:NhaC family Na+:H+ antiporter
MTDVDEKGNSASFIQAVFTFFVLATGLILTTGKLNGSPHVPLLFATAVAASIGLYNRVRWTDMLGCIASAYADAAAAMLVMLLIGVIIATWIAGGIVPVLIFYGLKVLSPDHFLLASCLICTIVSLATGSSWTTIGTVGLALAGIGLALDTNAAITAGAIVSGAYFGDKMSPLSDTTNLAPAITGVNLFEHIRHMAFTTGPAYVCALIVFFVIDLSLPVGETSADIELLTGVLNTLFNLSPWLLTVPLLTIIVIAFKIPAIPSLFVIALLGALCAIFVQGAEVASVIIAVNDGFQADTGLEQADSLLNRGGMQSMMWTISLILIGLAFAGTAEKAGIISAVADKILSLAKTQGGLIFATLVTTAFTAMATGVQYVALIIPGRLYKDIYPAYGMHRKNLSRAMEDSGTVISPLVPWSTDGAFVTGVLGVSTLSYLPFDFFNLLCPVMSAIAGFTGLTITQVSETDVQSTDQTTR